MMKENGNQNSKLDKGALEKVAGGEWIHYKNDGSVNGPGYEMMKKLGDNFNRAWLSEARWTASLVQGLVDTFGAEGANDIVHAYSNPQIFFGVLRNGGYYLNVLPEGI